MPEISRFFGIVISMFYNEHNPPHFHIEYSGNKASIDIETGLVKGKMSRRALKLVFEWMDEHKDELFDNWELARQNKELIKIDPLV
jgi:hypothetical protein